MPIWLRKFTFHEIQEFYNKEQKEIDKANAKASKSTIPSTGKISPPKFKTPSKTSYN
tara:strand:+ start:994 stop:1164 length:171 start_codon:yes stop_codon:yes gene_type:complete